MDRKPTDPPSSDSSNAAGLNDPTVEFVPSPGRARGKQAFAPTRTVTIDLVKARAAVWAAAGVVAIIVALVVWKTATHHASSVHAKVRLAVMPFQNLTGDPKQDYVSDGFAEETTNQLGRLNHDQLGVIARTSAMHYKNSPKPVRDIARELHVDYILEGSVRSGSGGLRISTQLIRAGDDAQIWSQEYDRPVGDLMTLESDVARTVADEIQVQLVPQPSAPAMNGRVNSDAYVHYLQGRYSFNRRTGDGLFDAATSFDQAIREDPNFASAYAGLADAYNMQAYYGYARESAVVQKARAAAIRATELDPALAEGHASLGYIYFLWDWDWPDAEREMQHAIALNDNYAPAHHWYALYLASMGRLDEARDQIARAHEIDPLSAIVTTASAYIDYFAARDSDAISKCNSVIEQDAKFVVAHTVLGLASESKRDYPKAIAEFQQALALSAGRPAAYVDNLGHAYAMAGQKEKADAVLRELETAVAAKTTSEAYATATLTGLGQRDRALDAMEKNFTKGTLALLFLKVDPRFVSLRTEPRFEALLQRGGFVQ
jgi:TolB-like protein/Flp pilus assembly protein TadD